MVEAGAVRGYELAGGELGAGAFTEVHPIAGGVFAEVDDDLVAGAEQGDTGREVRDDHHPVLFVEMAGEVDAGVEREVAAVEGEALETMIAAVGHQSREGEAPRRSRMRPWGLASCPAAVPWPPKERRKAPLASYWLMK